MTDKIHVMIVDDEPTNCKAFQRLFRNNLSVNVYSAISVDEALTMLDKLGTFLHIVVADQRMPKRQGHELLMELKKHDSKIYRILTTANEDEADKLMANPNLSDVIQHLFLKPWNPKQIIDLVLSVGLTKSTP